MKKSSGWTSTPIVAVIKTQFPTFYCYYQLFTEQNLTWPERIRIRKTKGEIMRLLFSWVVFMFLRSYLFSNSPVRWRFTNVVLPAQFTNAINQSINQKKQHHWSNNNKINKDSQNLNVPVPPSPTMTSLKQGGSWWVVAWVWFIAS